MDQHVRAAVEQSIAARETTRGIEEWYVQQFKSNYKTIQGGRMTATAMMKIEDVTINIVKEMHVRASLEITFAALLEELGPYNTGAEEKPMPMKLEAWPGGRWFRDFGEGNGHFWGNVQAIKRPTLLEICGPLFASYPLVSNLQYRLKDAEGGTLISFRHTALGFIQEDHKAGVGTGWAALLERVRKHAEGSK